MNSINNFYSKISAHDMWSKYKATIWFLFTLFLLLSFIVSAWLSIFGLVKPIVPVNWIIMFLISCVTVVQPSQARRNNNEYNETNPIRKGE